jgi:hypothetical protein
MANTATAARSGNLSFTPRQKLEKALTDANTLRKKLKAAREEREAETWVGKAMLAGEAGGTAFALGYAHWAFGKNGEASLVGIPADLGTAVLLHGLAYVAGEHEKHVEACANGALALWTGRMGMKFGAKALAAKSGAGALGARPAGTVTPIGAAAAVGVPVAR